jgi:hypothetical protein
MYELRRFRTRVGMAVVVVVLAAGAAASAAGGAAPGCGASTATDAARDAALTRVGIFAGIEESEQPPTSRR